MTAAKGLTKGQLHTLRHMLGINTPNDRIPKPYRNYAAVPPGDAEYAELEKLGVVERYQARAGSDYIYFRCTPTGISIAIESHKSIRGTKSHRRYYAFLNLTDCLQDLTFREFLTNPRFKEIRDNA